MWDDAAGAKAPGYPASKVANACKRRNLSKPSFQIPSSGRETVPCPGTVQRPAVLHSSVELEDWSGGVMPPSVLVALPSLRVRRGKW